MQSAGSLQLTCQIIQNSFYPFAMIVALEDVIIIIIIMLLRLPIAVAAGGG